MFNIKEASEYLGVNPETLRRWEREGKINPIRTEGGHRRYSEEILMKFKFKPINDKLTIGYCRISTNGQKNDLERQINAVSLYCVSNGYQFKIIHDIGSGLNFNKKGLKELINLIERKEIERIVLNYKDRLMRFGFEIFEELCKSNNVKIEIINQTEEKTYEEELVEDVLTIITVFSAKLYGSRSHKNKQIIQENEKLFK